MTPRVIFLSGPFRHPDKAQMAENVLTAQAAAVGVARLGFIPYCPHSNIGHAYGLISEAHAEAINLAFLRLSDALYLLPGWGQSIGARGELEEAKRLGLPIFRSPAEVRAWAA